MSEEQHSDTFVYTLGSGWWPWLDIPPKYRSPSILRCTFPTRGDVFPPMLLFDGSLERDFYDIGNWRVNAVRAKDGRRMLMVNMSMPSLGIQYVDVLQDAELFKDISVKERIDFQFGFFNARKLRQVFVLDVRKANGIIVTNRQLLQFEALLEEHGFDFRNFIYVANDVVAGPGLFDGCRAKTFMYRHDAPGLASGNGIHNTRYLFAHDAAYIRARIQELKNEQP